MKRLVLAVSLAALAPACSRSGPAAEADPVVSVVVTGPGLIEALVPRGETLVLANFWATW